MVRLLTFKIKKIVGQQELYEGGERQRHVAKCILSKSLPRVHTLLIVLGSRMHLFKYCFRSSSRE